MDVLQPTTGPAWDLSTNTLLPAHSHSFHQHRSFLWTLAFGLFLCGVAPGESPDDLHWSFRSLRFVPIERVQRPEQNSTYVDRYLLANLEKNGLEFSEPAAAVEFVRRISLNLAGIPASFAESRDFVTDDRPDALDRIVDRLLASPRYGERWGKYWLDAAGFADSNGYFNADSDRPNAYLYRDYVIRATNGDVPFDQFIQEQLAGDEIARRELSASTSAETLSFPSLPGKVTQLPDQLASERVSRLRELLAATHYLRNAQDGTTESDGNPDEVTIDRATVLEGCVQVTMNSLLGLTIQCARCHEHKFEPIPHEDYYRLQAVFYPSFPAYHVDLWTKPRDRFTYLATQRELDVWQESEKRIDERLAALQAEYRSWWQQNRPAGLTLFEDRFDSADRGLELAWSNSVPGDDGPAGTPEVNVGKLVAPGAAIRDRQLVILESGGAGDRWLCSKQVFDWTPDRKDDWIQVSFDLVADKAEPNGKAAERIGYCIALHDFNDNGTRDAGNLLVDGNPAGGASLHLDYPGNDSKQVGQIGAAGYRPGKNYGIRITNVGKGKVRIDQLVDGQRDGANVTLNAVDLPDGAFGFEYCCRRSFVVDNVVVEGASGQNRMAFEEFAKKATARQAEWESATKLENSKRTDRPGLVAHVSDVAQPVPDVYVLARGNYKTPTQRVEPAGLTALGGSEYFALGQDSSATGPHRRMAFARWLTHRDGRAAALMARVTANRAWQYHFGTGIVASSGNLGRSGSPPSNPELLERLAFDFVETGWSMKRLQRQIVLSTAYRQSTHPESLPVRLEADPDNLLLSRFPLRRLDAEAARDTLLFVSGELDFRMYGPFTPSRRNAEGAVLVDETHPGARRRAIYLQQRRTQVESFLEVFDAPAMLTTCSQRGSSTVPLQSLTMLNSQWTRARSEAFARRVSSEVTDTVDRMQLAYELAVGRPPGLDETLAALEFLKVQQAEYGPENVAQAWVDLCQMLLASNPVLYVE